MLRGVEVNPDTIMPDLLAAVGPGGTFLDQPRSVSRARQEIWVPSVLDRQPYVLWKQAGSSDMAERAMAKARKLLKTHQPTPLDPAAAAQIAAILEETAGT